MSLSPALTNPEPSVYSLSNGLARIFIAKAGALDGMLAQRLPNLSASELRKKASVLVFSAALANICQRLIQGKGAPSVPAQLALGEEPGSGLFSLLREYGRLLCSPAFSLFEGAKVSLTPDIERQLLKLLCYRTYPLNCHELGYIYEKLFSADTAKKEGIYYTPPVLARRIVNSVLLPRLVNSRSLDGVFPTVLDPACGSGVFLVEAYKLLLQQAELDGAQSFARKSAILTRCIFGVDKDPVALEVTRLSLIFTLLESENRPIEISKLSKIDIQLQCGNALFDTADFDASSASEQALLKELKVFSWQERFPKVFGEGGFECIVGNPPYGLSRGEQISESENVKLKAVYEPFRSGKVNKYLAFMARGYQLLSPSGRMSFVVPNAWLGIRGGEPLRKYVLQDGALESVDIFHCEVFEDVSLEAVTFVFDRAKRHESIKLNHLHDLLEAGAARSMSVKTSSCLASPACAIPVFWSQEVEELLAHIDSRTIRIGDADSPFLALIALQAYALGKGMPPQTADDVRRHAFHRRGKEDENTYPYLNGSDVKRFKLSWGGDYLRYGPWLAEYQPIERYSCPRILVREIISPPPYILSACFTKETFIYNRSLLHILPKSGTDESMLLALLGILNSKAGSFLMRFRGRKSQRKLFPKVVNDDLNDFRIPKDLQKEAAVLAPIVLEMLSAAEGLSAYEEALSAAVAKAYQLSESQMQILDQVLMLG